jgi:hypothetical protein
VSKVAAFVLSPALFALVAISIVFSIAFLTSRKRGRPVASLILLYVTALLTFGFILGLAGVTSIRIYGVGANEFFVEQVVPFSYWLGLVLVAGATAYLLLFYEKKNPMALVVLALMLLAVSIRMIFPGLFVSPPSYEPDTYYYMNVVDGWTKNGINFGEAGMYQHDFPMSFLIANVFVKLGVPVDEFFRWAPSFVYALDILLLYLIYKEIVPRTEGKNAVPVALMFFLVGTLKYFLTIEWCPNLVGATFLLLALLMSVRFSKKGIWKAKTILPVLATIFILILSHHLSILYLVITLFGLAIITQLYKIPELRGGSLSFFILAICTYTIWFAYGSYFYPSFFNIYNYLSGSAGSPAMAISGQGLLDRLTFFIQPVFVLIFSFWGLLRSFEIKDLSDLVPTIGKLIKRNTSFKEDERLLIVFAAGFFLIFLIMLAGVAIPDIYPDRVFDVLLVGMYPLAGLTFTRFCSDGSKKRKVLLLVVLVLLVLVSTYRYNRGQQMRLAGS